MRNLVVLSMFCLVAIRTVTTYSKEAKFLIQLLLMNTMKKM